MQPGIKVLSLTTPLDNKNPSPLPYLKMLYFCVIYLLSFYLLTRRLVPLLSTDRFYPIQDDLPKSHNFKYLDNL